MPVTILLIALAGLFSARLTSGIPKSEPPLNNEAVVLMTSEGRPEKEIIRIIEASSVHFELDPEMVVELERAGVSTRIIEAMRRRQAEAGVSPPPLPPPASPLMGNFELVFVSGEPGGGKEPSFFVIKEIPKALADRMTLDARAEVDELALFVVCTDPLHVPDHWMDRTNIKKFRRHAALGFRPGSRQQKKKGFQVLQLDLSAPLTGQAPEGTHRLSIGVAARSGSEWLVVQSDEWSGAVIHANGTTQVEIRLSSDLSGSMMTGYQAKQDLTIEKVADPEERP